MNPRGNAVPVSTAPREPVATTSEQAAARGLRIVSPAGEIEDPASWDAATCEAFVQAQYQRVYRWFAWLTQHPDRAADLTQDTFAAFWRSVRQGKRIRYPQVWLLRIARNLWRGWCRTKRRHAERAAGGDPSESLQNVPAFDAPAWDRLAANDAARDVGAQLDRLKPKYREVVVLRFWCDCSSAEIGRVLGIPGSLARWRLHHALQLLKGMLHPVSERAEEPTNA